MNRSKILNLPVINDARGNLTFVENQKHIPFNIKRVYWLYDVPGGATRGGHAYKASDEFIIALSGSFDILLKDSVEEKLFHMNRSYFGLYVPNGTWRQIENFSTNAVCMIIASTPYDKSDYIYDFNNFLKFKKNEK